MRHTRANEAAPMLDQDVKVLSAAMLGAECLAQRTEDGEWLRWSKLRQRTRRSLIKLESRSEAANWITDDSMTTFYEIPAIYPECLEMAPLGSSPSVCSREEHWTFLEVRGSAEDDPTATFRFTLPFEPNASLPAAAEPSRHDA